MKKPLIFMICCIVALAFTTSCTTESLGEDETKIQNKNNITQTPTLPPINEHGDDDKDKDKDRD